MTDQSIAKTLSFALSESGFTINGVPLPGDVTENALITILGPPDRIQEGKTPAPPGHRNNRIHFYDRHGVYWMQNHKTWLMMALGVVFHPDVHNPLQRHTRFPFVGELWIMDCRLDRRSTVQDLTAKLGHTIRKRFGGLWVGHTAGHDYTFKTRVLENRDDEIADVEIAFGKPLFENPSEE